MENNINPSSVGVIVLILMILTRWLWDYNRARREDAESHEPKANPPLHQVYAPLARVEKLEGEVSGLKSTINDAFREAAHTSSNSRQKIYDRLNEQGETLATLSGQFERIAGELVAVKDDQAEFNKRIDALPTRMITLLRETKGLI